MLKTNHKNRNFKKSPAKPVSFLLAAVLFLSAVMFFAFPEMIFGMQNSAEQGGAQPLRSQPQEGQAFQESDSLVYSESGESYIKEINTGAFPEVSIYLNYQTEKQQGSESAGRGPDELNLSNVKITENGNAVDNFKIERLSETSEPVGVVLVIDASGSMMGQPLDDAKTAALSFISKMRSIDKTAVVGFSDIVTVFSSFTSDRERLAGAVNLLDAEGETALFDGIIKGLEQFDNFPDLRHKYLVVLSDGADTVSTAGVEEAIQQALQGGTVVYSIGLTSKEFNFEGIEKIAGSTGGYMLSTSDSAMLEQLYEVALQKIQGIYRITYESGIQEADSIAAEIIVEEGSYRDSLNFSFENPYTVFSGSTVVSQDRSLAISNLVFLDKWWIKLIIFISIFVSVTLFIYAISTIMIPSNRDLKSRTDYFLYNIAEPGAEPPSDEKRARGRFFSRSAKKNRKSSDKKDFTSVFDEKLKRAGVSMSGSRFVLIHIISVAVATLVVFLLTRNLLVTFAVVVIVIFLPFLFVNFKIGQKLKKFNEQLPDTLQLIEGALKAGYSLNQALYMVIKETKPPISEEFSMALNEIRMGLTEKAALENMAKRINSELFSWVILAINIQREVGGNLAEIMDIIANTIRDKERVLRQIKGLTAEGKLSAYVLIGLPIILGVVLSILNREYINVLFTTKIGFMMLGLGAVLMVIGIIWILKIIKIEY